MKKLITVLLSLMTVVGSSVYPANAIFGFSSCEKVKKQITSEEQVGLEFHKTYRKQLNLLNNIKNPTYEDGLNAWAWVSDVYDSDIRVYKIVDANNSCFTAKEIAKARTSRTATLKEIKGLADVQTVRNKDPKFWNMKLNATGIKAFLSIYPKYYSFLDNKALD